MEHFRKGSAGMSNVTGVKKFEGSSNYKDNEI